jgi:hypothetical protein
MSPPATGTGTKKVVFSITLSLNNRLKPECQPSNSYHNAESEIKIIVAPRGKLNYFQEFSCVGR